MSNPQSQLVTCPECKGTGNVRVRDSNMTAERLDICNTCRGLKTISLEGLAEYKKKRVDK